MEWGICWYVVCGMWYVECDMWYVGMWVCGMLICDMFVCGMWYVVSWCWYVGMVIGVAIVDFLSNFFVKVRIRGKWIFKSTIREKYDHIENLKVWRYNM
jgi:hypothetical protein